MTKKLLCIVVSFAVIAQSAAVLRAGGLVETLDISGDIPAPIPNRIVAKVIPIRWDDRSIPVSYRVNVNTPSPTPGTIPNPLGVPFLTIEDATAVLQESLDVWNAVPTSYIDMRIVGTVSKTTVSGFDFVNEITFRTANGFPAIAASPSVTLIQDVVLEDGDLIDNDLDSDVSNLISVPTDVDGDGDLEFPAGFYKAGTIFDNDVQFNTKMSNGMRFTIPLEAADINTRSVDLMAVAVHEFGHSLGLSHTADSQYSVIDGAGSVMFPFFDTGDPAAELSQRKLKSDDIAWASYHYPEGTASSGPAALHSGDVAFSSVYGWITGELRHGILQQPIAGGSVYAINRQNGAFVASGFSGTTQVAFNPVTGGVDPISPGFSILNGKYVIPVPKGGYDIGIEPIDGSPVPAGTISLAAQIGSMFGQMNFNEERYTHNKEDVIELRPGQAKNVHVNPGATQSEIDITTNRTININNFGTRDLIGFNGSPAGLYYAVRIAASQVRTVMDQVNAENPGKDVLVQAIAFDTAVLDASVAPVFAEAMLTTGTLNGDGTIAAIDLINPLQRVEGFIGADNDFAPLFFQEPHELGRIVRDGISSGAIQNLFLVLRNPTTTPFPGVSNRAPLIGLDVISNEVPIPWSYMSTDGGTTFTRSTTFNFRFSLVLSEPVVP